MLQVRQAQPLCPRLQIQIRRPKHDVQRTTRVLDGGNTACGCQEGFSRRRQVKSPSLRSPNKFEGLAIEETVDTSIEVAIDSDHVHNNSRGSQVTELGAPEACLIPVPVLIDESETVETKAKPEKGEKHFIRSAHLEREILLDMGITTLDTDSTMSLKALLDNGATGLFIDREFVH